MLKTISATKARINFGDVMKQAKIAPVIVERAARLSRGHLQEGLRSISCRKISDRYTETD